jgi:hypothetical protein
MRLNRALCIWLMVGLGTVSACHRHSGPSKDFERAHQAFTRLYAQKLDEAYLDPAMASIEESLQRVPPNSVDADDAHKLAQRIAEGRARMEKAQEERRKASEAALKAPANLATSDSTFLHSSLDAGIPEAPDAGLSQPTAGMPRAEFEKRFSGCFEAGEPVDVQGRGIRDTYRLRDITNCRERHPGYDGSIVLMEGSNVLGVVPKTALFSAYPDGGRAPTDAGGPAPPGEGTATPDAGTAAEVPDAGYY